MANRKLERVADITGRLFDHATEPAKTPPNFPKCPLCGNWGYTNCPQAKAPAGDYLAIAFREGAACSCAAGAEFAKNQMEWMSNARGSTC